MNSTWASWLATAAATASLALAAGCGGGGGGSSPPPSGGGGTNPPTQGIDGVGIAVGPITGFGSVIVNGVRFDTTGAQVRIDDNPGVESDLQVGQVVVLKGRYNSDGTTGTAETIDYNDAVEGPVTTVDLAAGTLGVMGQVVRVTASTVFDNRFANPSLAGIAVGSIVEVSGYPNAAGEIVATRIEPKAAGQSFEVFGTVSSLTSTRFNLAATVVDYSTAQVANGTLTNGACVEVKGSALNGGVLAATRVEVKSCNPNVVDGDRGQVEGIVTRFASATDFDVGSVRVTTNASTTYERGAASDLRLNLKVEAEGTFDANRTLVARKVQIKPDNSARLLGTVESIDAGAGSVNIFSVRVLVDAGTALEDKSNADLRPFRFADLRTGDYLEVRGFEEATAGSMRAVLLEREDLDSRRELQGRATDVASPGFRLIGVAVQTDGATEYRDASDASITAQQFFQQAANRLVKVRGSWDGAAFRATRAELEN
jgi:hypothetical protein